MKVPLNLSAGIPSARERILEVLVNEETGIIPHVLYK